MKIALFGAGRMGRTIARMVKKLGDHSIHSWDEHSELIPECDGHNSGNIKDLSKIEEFDLVISSLPYHLNPHIASLCIDAGITSCDLGGSVPVSKQINDLAKINNATVFTDLGLAPGWANILAEEAFQQIVKQTSSAPDTINMRCGGLPVRNITAEKDPFNYVLTWSPEGLYNEYVDDSHVLCDGLMVRVPSLSEREIVSIEGFPDLEAFTTSGGASHTLDSMKQRGVSNCSYKTLRYKGHLDLMLYFLRRKQFDAKQLAELFNQYGGPDVVIVEVEARCSSSNTTYRKTKIVKTKDGYSAMQRATAGGLVSAIFASPLDHGSPLTYADIDIKMFNDNMKILGVAEVGFND